MSEVRDKMLKWVEGKVERGDAFIFPAGRTKLAIEARTFDEKLNSCRDIGELEGFANRRRFNLALPKWSEDERRKIIFRKAEMTNKRKKK